MKRLILLFLSLFLLVALCACANEPAKTTEPHNTGTEEETKSEGNKETVPSTDQGGATFEPITLPFFPPVTEPSTPPATEPSNPPATEPSNPPATEPSTPPATEPSNPPATEPSTPPATEPSIPTPPESGGGVIISPPIQIR
jgi:hypothetical protein